MSPKSYLQLQLVQHSYLTPLEVCRELKTLKTSLLYRKLEKFGLRKVASILHKNEQRCIHPTTTCIVNVELTTYFAHDGFSVCTFLYFKLLIAVVPVQFIIISAKRIVLVVLYQYDSDKYVERLFVHVKHHTKFLCLNRNDIRDMIRRVVV